MALPRSLCGILTIWIVATRPSPAVLTGSLDTSPWWAAKIFEGIQAESAKRQAAGDLSGQEAVLQEGYRRAQRVGNRPAQIAYLTGIANTRLLRFQYSGALQSYLEAKRIAELSRGWSQLGAISANIASVYEQIGNYALAVEAAKEGRKATTRLKTTPFYEGQLLIQLARLMFLEYGETDEGRAWEAIEASRTNGDVNMEAMAWDLLGDFRLRAANLDAAEAAFARAYVLRLGSPQLCFSYWRLGSVRLEQAKDSEATIGRSLLFQALEFTNKAIQQCLNSVVSPPLYRLLHQAGVIHEALGHTTEALENYRSAMEIASRWRRAIPPSGSNFVAADIGLSRIFDSFVSLAAAESLRRRDQSLAAEAFLANEANRAANLRETRLVAGSWRKKLPAEYWEVLGRLRTEEARLLRKERPESSTAKRLHLELSEMEAIAGVQVAQKKVENLPPQNSLILFQRGLTDSDLVLSFQTTETATYLWAVTNTSLHLYRISTEEVQRVPVEFREAIIAERPEAAKLGWELNRVLFGRLDSAELAKKSWLLSLDDALFEIPFAALVENWNSRNPVYLIEGHSLEIIPGAFFMNPRQATQGSGYLGVADAIYNLADARLPRHWWTGWTHPDDETQLNRLVSSGREIERTAEVWGAALGEGRTTVLLGESASHAKLLGSLQEIPRVIHLATHVLVSSTERDHAFLALSLGADRRPELLSPEDVASQHVPGAFVIMTGCESGTGAVAAGAGLLGLTRAWLAAGARAVIASSWPVPDSRGDLPIALSRFAAAGSPPAEALREGQLEMIHSTGWQASPSYWAAFQVTGGLQ